MNDLINQFQYPREPAAILAAYDRKVDWQRTKTGECWPIVPEHCVQPDRTITTTSVVEPVVIARWRRRSDGGYRIELVR